MKAYSWVKIAFPAILFIILLSSFGYFFLNPGGPCSAHKIPLEKDQCIADYAISNVSIKSCAEVTNRDVKEYCISEIAVSLKNTEACSLLVNNSRYACLSKIALEKNTREICAKIRDERWNSICLKNLALSNNDSLSCLPIEAFDIHDDCIIALAPDSLELCKRIIDSTKRNRCIRDIALKKGNATICRTIQDPLFRDSQCLKKMAQDEKKKEYCDMIINIAVRFNCYENVLNIELVDPATRRLKNPQLIKQLGLNIPEEMYG